MLNAALQDAQWLKSLPMTLGFDDFIWSRSEVDSPIRPYLQPVAWIEEKDGIYQYLIAAVFPLPDDKLAFIKWNNYTKRFVYEDARYITNSVPALTAKTPTGVNSLFEDKFDYKKEITLGKKLNPSVLKTLIEAIEGSPATDQSQKPAPV